jgi:hypothetical protein
MMWWHGIAGIAGMSRRCGGLWRFLITWSQGRTAVELERERNRATAEVLRLLPGGCELLEYERGGRLRVIRRPGPAEAGEAPAPPGAGGEISR